MKWSRFEEFQEKVFPKPSTCPDYDLRSFLVKKRLVEQGMEKRMRNDWRLFFRAYLLPMMATVHDGTPFDVKGASCGGRNICGQTCTIYSRSHALSNPLIRIMNKNPKQFLMRIYLFSLSLCVLGSFVRSITRNRKTLYCLKFAK